MWYSPLLIVSSFALCLGVGQVQQPTRLEQNVWESFAPGELLRLLEHSTYLTPAIAQRRSDSAPTTSLLPAEPEAIAYSTPQPTLKRTETSTDNTYEYPAEDQLYAPSSDEFNYDQAYEAFVRQYFSDKLAEEDDDSTEKNDDEALDGAGSVEEQLEAERNSASAETETEPLTEETKNQAQHKKKDKCRRVKKHKQNCMVCENVRTGEKSESCSFSRESEPQRYAFEKETSYKKQRDAEEPSSQSVEQTSSEEVTAKTTSDETNKRNIKNRRTQDKAPKDSSTCIQMVRRGKVCYQCVDGDGTTIKCYTPRNARAASDNRHRAAKGKEHKTKNKQQRIYKRTISYSYEKGTNGTNANESEHETAQLKNGTATNSSPQLKKKIYIKVVKENETVAE
ncbi:uncharacterized protein LOC101460341 [Ceratitis capitata]|uniref:uncharacterized protein LOC101460341 n=1 Tax=Ceratitis capitata TaxID=7213 RepID=UPI000A104707|nr:uncharacterized protein LOC101460341 [Ceratitis capitata]